MIPNPPIFLEPEPKHFLDLHWLIFSLDIGYVSIILVKNQKKHGAFITSPRLLTKCEPTHIHAAMVVMDAPETDEHENSLKPEPWFSCQFYMILQESSSPRPTNKQKLHSCRKPSSLRPPLPETNSKLAPENGVGRFKFLLGPGLFSNLLLLV